MFQKPDLEAILANINFAELKAKSIESLRSVFQSIDEQTKNEVHQWIADIRKIKNDETLSRAEKESKVTMVATSETILNFLSSLVSVLTNKFPVPKSLLRVGIAGMAVAAMARYRFGAIAAVAIGAALPKFLMSSKFDDFAAFIERELPKAETEAGLDGTALD